MEYTKVLTDLVSTGDSTDSTIWIVVALVAVVLLAVVFFITKKKKK